MKTIGKCSKCGGYVVEQEDIRLAPQCCKCGARKKDVLPVIEMEESAHQQLLLD